MPSQQSQRMADMHQEILAVIHYAQQTVIIQSGNLLFFRSGNRKPDLQKCLSSLLSHSQNLFKMSFCCNPYLLRRDKCSGAYSVNLIVFHIKVPDFYKFSRNISRYLRGTVNHRCLIRNISGKKTAAGFFQKPVAFVRFHSFFFAAIIKLHHPAQFRLPALNISAASVHSSDIAFFFQLVECLSDRAFGQSRLMAEFCFRRQFIARPVFSRPDCRGNLSRHLYISR